MNTGLEKLTDRQRSLLSGWLPDLEVVTDHSWGLADTTVLQVAQGGEHYIVKAGGGANHHLAREMRAHRLWLRPWTSGGRAPQMVQADQGANILMTRYLPGRLVLESDAVRDPDVYRQAGELLRLLHEQLDLGIVDDRYEERENAKTSAWLGQAHRISPSVEGRLKALVRSWPTGPTRLVPTHGDWQPRNWLVDDGVVSVIDFGRADLRPGNTDLVRLAAQEFRDGAELEAAFLDGYGDDPREPGAWHRAQVREAVGTAVWAFRVGDEQFEAQGHRMIAEALDKTF